MMHRTFLAVSLAAVLLPAAAQADDGGWQDDGRDDQGGWYDDQGGDGYDVSVDLDGQGAVDVSTFEQPLTPYGDWVSTGSYGHVWRPRVAAGWRPYYYGRWEWTTEGWLWVSDEPFGWATYHYGRWAFDRGAGWVWVPGTQWAPAWVSWRYSGDVVGWAPLAPGLSLYVTDFAFVDFWWTFVPTVRFCGSPIHRVAYAPHYSRRWWDATRPAPPRPGQSGSFRGGGRPSPGGPAWGGPTSRFVEERVGRPLRPSRIVPARAAGDHRARPGEISVFRPEARPRPSRGGDDRRFDRGGAGGSPGRGQGDTRPSRPAPGLDQPRRQERGLERAPERARPDGRGSERSNGRRWEDGRPAPQGSSRSEGPSFGRPERSAAPAPRSQASPSASPPPSRSAAPAPSAPFWSGDGGGQGGARGGGQGGGRGGGQGGGRDGGQGSRPAPPSGERGNHRR